MMATRDQLKEAILKADAAGDIESAQRFAEMYKAAPAGASAPAKRTFLGALAEGAGAAGPQAMRWMGNLDLNPANIPEHAATLGSALAGLPGAAERVAGGVLQQTRELSAPEFRGSAPALDKAPALAAETTVYNRYGVMPGPQRDKPSFNKQNALNTIATDPIGSVADVATAFAPIAGPAFKAAKIGEALGAAGAMMPTVTVPAAMSQRLTRVAEVLKSGKTAKDTTLAVREAAKSRAAGQQADLLNQASTATASGAERARAATLAQALQQQAEARAAQASQRAAFDQPAGVGVSTERSALGAPVQAAAAKAEAKLIADRNAADQVHRTAMEAVVKESESAGKSVADTPTAKQMLTESQARLAKPDVTTSPDISSPAMPELAKVDEIIAETLRNRTVQLSEAEAKAAKANGFTVAERPGMPLGNGLLGPPTYTRTFKTDFEALDNLGRRFGQAYGQDMEGFTALSANARRQAQQTIQRIKEEFTSNASAAVQKNWREAARNLDKYDVGMGKRLTGTQGDTDIPNITPNKVSGAIISGGREGYQRALNLTNEPATVRSMAENAVENALTDPITGRSLGFDAAARKLNKTDLSDMLTHPDLAGLKAKVAQHMERLNDAKMAGAEVDAFNVTAKEHAATAKAATGEATSFQGTAAQLQKEATRYQAEFIDLKNLPDKEVVGRARSLVKEMSAKGLIDPAEQEAFYRLANKAEKATGDRTLRNRIIAITLGLGATGKIGLGFVAGHEQ